MSQSILSPSQKSVKSVNQKELPGNKIVRGTLFMLSLFNLSLACRRELDAPKSPFLPRCLPAPLTTVSSSSLRALSASTRIDRNTLSNCKLMASEASFNDETSICKVFCVVATSSVDSLLRLELERVSELTPSRNRPCRQQRHCESMR